MPLAERTADAVTALAPDQRSVDAARRIVAPRLWAETGATPRAVWGTYVGTTGRMPYATAVDLAAPATRCTCPSRKVPCKHALALLYLWAASGVPEPADEPAAVATWLEERAARRGAASRRSAPAADPDAAAARRARRDATVAAGVEELERWLHDLVRRGFAAAARDPYAAWDAAAARMVDAQAPGLARRVRRLADAIVRGAAPSQALADAGRLALLLRAARRLDELDDGRRADVRAALGYPVPVAEVLSHGMRCDDAWLVCAVEEDVPDDRFAVQRTWMVGRRTASVALVLAFAPPAQAFAWSPAPFRTFDGTVARYPGTSGERVVLGAEEPLLRADPDPPPGAGIAEARRALTGAAAADPLAERRAVVLRDVRLARPAAPATAGPAWALHDVDGGTLPCACDDDGATRLLAIGAGGPLTAFGVLDRSAFRPLAAWGADGRLAVPRPLEAPRAERDVVSEGPWGPLVSAAVVGTGRRPLDPDVLPGPVRAVVDATEDGCPASTGSEERLLLAAGVLAAVEAGSAPPVDGGVHLVPSAPAEERTAAPPAAVDALRSALRVRRARDALVEEWVARADGAGWHVPAQDLPALLGGTTGPARRVLDRARGVLGARAVWIAAVLGTQAGLSARGAGAEGPTPRGADLDDVEARWRTGSPPERVALLGAIRAGDPSRGRALLEETWDTDPWDVRAQLIPALETGLGPDDEPLLRRALDDGRKPVRRAAAELLRRLPSSSLARRTAAAGLAAVRAGTPSGAVEVTPPAAPAAELDRAGFDPPPTGTGARAWWIRQVVGAVPLQRWADHLGAPAEELASADAGSWTDELRRAWRDATVRERDAAWAAALLRAGVLDAPLLGVADAAVREAVLADASRRLPASTVVALAAEAVPSPWGRALSTALLDATTSAGTAVAARLLGEVAARCDARALDELGRRLPTLDRAPVGIEEIMAVRRQLAAAFPAWAAADAAPERGRYSSSGASGVP